MTTPTIEKQQSSRIERLAIKLWGYARDHSRSLDSERHMAAIVQMVVDDIAWHDDRLEETRQRLAVAEATIEMLTREPPAMPKEGKWNKAKKMSAARAVWVIEYAVGRGVSQPLLARRLGVENVTVYKVVEGIIWAEETAKARAKYEQ